MEKTIVIIKPDGIQKKLIGEIIKRIEKEGLSIINIKIENLTKNQISKLYKESLSKFPQIRKEIIEYMTKKPSILIMLQGKDAIKGGRKIRGLSNPSKSPIGSIRRDFAGNQNMEELTKNGKVTKNVMHVSGNKEEVELETKLFFGEKR